MAYQRVLQIEDNIASFSKPRTHYVVYFPLNLVQGVSIYFAIDRTDLVNDAPEG